MAKSKRSSSRTIRPKDIGINSNSSINIRKIKNGLIVRVSRSSKGGEYKDEEYYASTNQEVKEIVAKAL